LYCQNIFILILKSNFGDLSLKYPFIIILLEYAIEKSRNATPFILSDMVLSDMVFFTYESCVYVSVVSRTACKWM